MWLVYIYPHWVVTVLNGKWFGTSTSHIKSYQVAAARQNRRARVGELNLPSEARWSSWWRSTYPGAFTRNSRVIVGLIKGNQWVFISPYLMRPAISSGGFTWPGEGRLTTAINTGSTCQVKIAQRKRTHENYRVLTALGKCWASFNFFWGNDPIWLIFFRWVETTN